MTTKVIAKEARREEERQLIEKELNEFWKEKDNYLILIITNSKGTKRLAYNYDDARQLILALVTAQMAEIGFYDYVQQQ
jgi:hypothetical protein